MSIPPNLCARYGVAVVDRRNRSSVVVPPATGWNAEFSYAINGTSEASITIGTSGSLAAECCDRLPLTGEWGHELVFFREGLAEEAWVGPLIKGVDPRGQNSVTLRAVDRSSWWDARRLTVDRIYTGTGQADASTVSRSSSPTLTNRTLLGSSPRCR